MIVLLSGATHAGKTLVASELIQYTHYPCISMDLLKMGLIRSGNTTLTVEDDEELTTYLWKIVKEMIHTAIENHQHLMIEGCYIPFDWMKDFQETELNEIRYCCLVLSNEYIEKHFQTIIDYENVIEYRKYSNLEKSRLIKEHQFYLDGCQSHHLPYVCIDDYDVKQIMKQVKQELRL